MLRPEHETELARTSCRIEPVGRKVLDAGADVATVQLHLPENPISLN